jgi:Mg2+ and Co2+ transporter CorA
MKKQAQRATLLTVLAVIYLPLTLVTSIFGMNIKEIDRNAPSFWVSIVVLVAIAGLTAAGYLGYRYWRRKQEARELKERKEEIEQIDCIP